MTDIMSIWLQIGGKIVPGQNDTFAPVVPQVPGQFSRCPCGVGAYATKCYLSRHFLWYLYNSSRDVANLITKVPNRWHHAGMFDAFCRHKFVYAAPGWRQFAVTPVPDNKKVNVNNISKLSNRSLRLAQQTACSHSVQSVRPQCIFVSVVNSEQNRRRMSWLGNTAVALLVLHSSLNM